MKTLIFSLGSRGDMEPLLAIAGILKSEGWDVICGMPSQFRYLVEDYDLSFSPLSGKFIEFMESDIAKNFMGQKGPILKRLKDLFKIYKQLKPMAKEIVEQQRKLIQSENPDRILYNSKCLYPILWGMANPGKSFMVTPIPGHFHVVRGYLPMVPLTRNFGFLFNKLFYFVSNKIFSKIAYSNALGYDKEFKKLNISAKSIKRFITKEQILMYVVSPSLFKRPQQWPKNAIVMGYFKRQKTLNWKPDEDLLDFIKKNKKIIFITFGSMVNSEPEKKTLAILNVLKKHEIAAIINTSSGGLEKIREITDLVYFTNNIPYDWIFPKVYAVIHHGGSGTTHMALRYGCASMVIPHILDQYFWNHTVSKIGAGPKGIPIKRLNEKSLEPLLVDLFRNESYKLVAEKISEKMSKEDFKGKLLKFISNLNY